MNKKMLCPKCGYDFDNDAAMSEMFDKQKAEAVAKEVAQKEKELRTSLQKDFLLKEQQLKSELSKSTEEEIRKLNKELVLAQESAKSAKENKDKDIAIQTNELKKQIEQLSLQKDLVLQQQKGEFEKKLSDLKSELNVKTIDLQNKLATKDLEFSQKQSEWNTAHEFAIKQKDAELLRKDKEIEDIHKMRSQLNVKLIGETLEQHCELEFEKVRAMAFPNAYFEKDNKVVKEDDEAKGSKGDYIFREFLENSKTELVSIMFEMKNEDDGSTHKKSNKDYFAQLDKNRTKKECEYAVLVSLLEKENEHYNQGIVECYGYSKMYVIRPQFFIPLISLV
ncbi:MAG: DUF2130 domain-containing protein, partial [Firmicutes bacterium]|nr:DUF2130 domain-containing protein [Bacillota bacterium]